MTILSHVPQPIVFGSRLLVTTFLMFWWGKFCATHPLGRKRPLPYHCRGSTEYNWWFAKLFLVGTFVIWKPKQNFVDFAALELLPNFCAFASKESQLGKSWPTPNSQTGKAPEDTEKSLPSTFHLLGHFEQLESVACLLACLLVFAQLGNFATLLLPKQSFKRTLAFAEVKPIDSQKVTALTIAAKFHLQGALLESLLSHSCCLAHNAQTSTFVCVLGHLSN